MERRQSSKTMETWETWSTEGNFDGVQQLKQTLRHSENII